MNKTVRLGTIEAWEPGRAPVSVFAKIEYRDGELSITGVEGPRRGGNADGSCGQIEMSYRTPEERAAITPAPGWTPEMIAQFFDVWGRWHLNKMRAGSPAQSAYLRDNPIEDRMNHYERASEALRDAGLNPDPYYLYSGPNSRPAEPHPYKYGEAWLREEVPADVIEWLNALPEADKVPAWI